MSWLEKIVSDFDIVTGDGKRYAPHWMNAVRTKEFNVAEYEFINVPGTLVSRGTPKGRRYNLEIHFQGEEHLDQAEAFDRSCDDPRPWKITHPFYGFLLVHPLSIALDNSQYNVSKFNIPVVETIDESNPKIVVNLADRTREFADRALQGLEAAFGLTKPKTIDVIKMKSNLDKVYNQGKKAAKLTEDATAYFNAYNKAYSAISNLITLPLECIRLVQTAINMPALFVDSVKNRIDSFVTQFNTLNESIQNLDTYFDRVQYEQFCGTIVGSMCVTSVTETDYRNRSAVLDVMGRITDTYDAYILSLDTLQGENGGDPDSYIPDQAALIELSKLVSHTVSNLFAIAINSKQERIVDLEEDTNIILVAHRFYGLTADDSTIERIIEDNNIGLNELLQLKKGRKIVYTV